MANRLYREMLVHRLRVLAGAEPFQYPLCDHLDAVSKAFSAPPPALAIDRSGLCNRGCSVKPVGSCTKRHV